MSRYFLVLCIVLTSLEFLNALSLNSTTPFNSNSTSSTTKSSTVKIKNEGNNQTEAKQHNNTLTRQKVVPSKIKLNRTTTSVPMESGNKDSSSRACPYCVGNDCNDTPAGYFLSPTIMGQVLFALACGTVIYFALLFSYKKWSFTDLPYHTSTYYGGGGGYSGKGGWGQSSGYNKRRISHFNPPPTEKSLLSKVWDAIDRLY